MNKVVPTKILYIAAIVATVSLEFPARAEMDFSGEWAPRHYEDAQERGQGPEIGDYLGLPINAAARLRADSWEGSIITLPEWQCRPHPGDEIWRGPSQIRIWKEEDPASREITAYHIEWLRSVDRPIYMDGRPHPSEFAKHTWAGFSTGKWEGDMLTVHTTHFKESLARRNGVPRSDRATAVEHWMRHGDWLTVVTITTDPVYLTEPLIRTTDFELDLHQHIPQYPCDVVEEIDRPSGVVPHHLPGTNRDISEFAGRYNLPMEPTRGGAETMYPEYQLKLKGMKSAAAGKSNP